MTVLESIMAAKRMEVDAARARMPLETVRARAEREAGAPRDFVAALATKIAAGGSAVIAEAKRASPSAGVIRTRYVPAEIAMAYERAGAACMSVLTDPGFFGGRREDLVEARAASTLPVLRKDFLFDPYQVYEARAMGADCVLLIVACLDDRRLRELAQLALALGMAVLPEVHDRRELDRALRLDTPLVGINNRDLRSLDVSLSTTLDLASAVPAGKTLVTESGIATARDVAVMREAGVQAFLVGEALMGFDDPAEGFASMFGSAAALQG